MRAKLLIAGIFVLLTFVTGASAAKAVQFELESAFVEGVDYRRMDAQSSAASEPLEIFYWYGCRSCYQVEAALANYLADKSGISLKRTPLVAYLSWRPQAYIQPVSEQLASYITQPLEAEIYQQCLDDCSVFSDINGIKSWFQQRLSLETLPYIDESLVWSAEKAYRQRADQLSILQVPTIIIRGQYLVDASSAQSVDRFIQIIDYLLTANPS